MTRLVGTNRGRASYVRVRQQAQPATPRPVPAGWTSPLTFAQTETAPQEDTVGDNIHNTFGPGLDDTVHWPTEKSPPATAVTLTSGDFSQDWGTPSRASMAVSGEVQLFENVPQITGRRVFYLSNQKLSSQNYVALTCFIANDMYIMGESAYEQIVLVPQVVGNAADDVACALVEPDAETSELLCFIQKDGVVTCTPVELAAEPRELIEERHVYEVGVPGSDPTDIQAMATGAAVQIATGGRMGDTTGWVAGGFGADLFFSSMKAVTLEDRKVLLLHLTAAGVLNGHIIGYEDGVVTVENTTEIGTGIVNLYQAVTSDYGLEGGDKSRLVMTCRTATAGTGRAYVLSAAAEGVTVEASTALNQDYSHAAWCKNRIVILTKAGYSAAGTLGWGTSTVNLTVYDQSLAAVQAAVNASSGLTGGIQQTVTIHGWADGRLYMHATSFSPIQNQIGHSYEYDGGGVRLYVLKDEPVADLLVLQDQLAELDDASCVSIETYRLGDDAVIHSGRCEETYGSPPGQERSMFSLAFVGGAQKECNADLHAYRLTDDWVVTIEPEKNSYWWTTDLVIAPDWNPAQSFETNMETTMVRAHHVSADGDIDIIGRAGHVHINGGWYNTGCRIDDTHFMTLAVGDIHPADFIDRAAEGGFLKVWELDPVTGDLAEVARRPAPGGFGDRPFRAYATGVQTLASAASGIEWLAPAVPNDGVTFSGGTTPTFRAGTWSLQVGMGTSVSTSGLTFTITARDADTNAVVYTESAITGFGTQASGTIAFRVTHSNDFTVHIALSGGTTETILPASKLTAACKDWVFFNGVEQTTDDSGLYVVLGPINQMSSFDLGGDRQLVARTFRLGEDYTPIVIDTAVVEPDPEGPGFPERNPYGLTRVTESKYVATWVRTIGSSHWSAFTGFVVDGDGTITVGSTLDPEVDNRRYGFQGTWMGQPCAMPDGRFLYPVFDEWFGSTERFPNFQSGSLFVAQMKPYAVMICDVSDAGVLNPKIYPLKVDRDLLDADTLAWYEAAGFFATELVNASASTHPRAHPDGYIYEVWDISACLPDPTPGAFWLWQGPSPVPHQTFWGNDAYTIAQYTIDENALEAVYVPDSWAQFALPSFVNYGNGAVVVREGLFALVASIDYHCRLSPHGYNSAFGTLCMRLFGPARGRGTILAGARTLDVYRTAKNVSPDR